MTSVLKIMVTALSAFNTLPAMAEEESFSIAETQAALEKYDFKEAFRIRAMNGSDYVLFTRNPEKPYWMLQQETGNQSDTLAEGPIEEPETLPVAELKGREIYETSFYHNNNCADLATLGALLQSWKDSVLYDVSGDNNITKIYGTRLLFVETEGGAGHIYMEQENQGFCMLAQGPRLEEGR